VIERIIVRKDRGSESDGAGQLTRQGRVGSLDGAEERTEMPLRKDLEGAWGVGTRGREGLASGKGSTKRVWQEQLSECSSYDE